MESLQNYIIEALGGEDKQVIKETKNKIKEYLKKYYMGASYMKISKNPDDDGKFIVNATYIETKTLTDISTLTNELFKFGPCKYMEIVNVRDLVSLEGAPQEVEGDCKICICPNLKSLKGCPQNVKGNFECSNTGIISLEDGPTEVGNHYKVNDNNDLKTLNGAPKKVYGHFDCSRCENPFTEKDVKSVCKVEGDILVDHETQVRRGGQGRGGIGLV